MSSLLKRVKNPMKVGLAQISGHATGIMVTIFFARTMSVANFGIYTGAIAAMGLVAGPICGGPARMLMRDAALCNSGDRTAEWRVGHSLSIPIVLSLAAMLFSLLLYFAGSVSGLYVTASLGIPAVATITLISAKLRGEGKAVHSQLLASLLRPALVLTGVAVWCLGHDQRILGPNVAVGIQLVALTLTALAAFSVSEGLSFRLGKESSIQWAQAVLPFCSFGALVAAESHLPKVIMNCIRAPEETAVIGLGLQAVFLTLAPLTSLSITYTSRIVGHWESSHKSELLSLIGGITVWGAVGSGAMLATFLAFGPQILEATVGSPYIVYSFPLSLFIVAGFIESLSGPAGLALNLLGGESQATRCRFAKFLVMILGMILLVPKWGVLGGAVAWIAASSTWSVSIMISLRARLNGKDWSQTSRMSA